MKAILFTLLMTIPLLKIQALDVCIDGVYYHLDETQHYAEVTNGEHKYSGSVVIPSSIACNGLVCSVVSIGEKAFYDCVDLTSVKIAESVTTIGGLAFCWCSNLKSIEIPDGALSSIGWYAFGYCRSLSSISIPKTVTEIGYGAFTGCVGFSSVKLPPYLNSISSALFENCTGLIHIEIPEGTSSIGNSAFGYCSSLETIVMPSTIKQIDSYAFIGCNKIKDVFCYSETLPEIEAEAFDSFLIGSATLHVLDLSVAAGGDVSEPWCWFGSVVPMETRVDAVRTIPSPVGYYSLGGVYSERPVRGITIIKNSDGTTRKVYVK